MQGYSQKPHRILWTDDGERIEAETINQSYAFSLAGILARDSTVSAVVVINLATKIAYEFDPRGVIVLARNTETNDVLYRESTPEERAAAAERAQRGPHWQGGAHINAGPPEE